MVRVRKPGLSERQKSIFKFIRDFIAEKGYPPSVRDIVRGCHISSTSVVEYNLNILEERGLIRCDDNVSRGIELLQKEKGRGDMVSVPLLGQIAAGEPIPVPHSDTWSGTNEAEFLKIPAELMGKRDKIFALRVKGTSMIDALIDDGDIVIMQQVNTVDSGEMAAVWLKTRNEVTLKKVYPHKDKIKLQPANRLMKPIYLKSGDIEIQGKVVCVIRKLG